MRSTRERDRAKGRGRVATPVSASLLALALGLVGSEASADWFDDFDVGFSESWTFVALDDVGNPPSTGVSTFQIIEAGADDHLRMSHSTTAFRDGGGGATDAFGFVDEIFSDLAISAELNANPGEGQQSLLTVVARGNASTGTAYVAGVDFTSSTFGIGRSGDLVDFFTPLAVDASVAIDPGRRYRVQFFLIGIDLTARLIDGATGELLSTVTVQDGLYASGLAGILLETAYDGADFPIGPIVGTFDDVEAVPEPSATGMLILGAAGVGALARRRMSTRRAEHTRRALRRSPPRATRARAAPDALPCPDRSAA